MYFLPSYILYTHFIKEHSLVTISFPQPLHQPLPCSILLFNSKCRNGIVESNTVCKYQPGMIVNVNVMMLAFISKPHRLLLFFQCFSVLLNGAGMIDHCKAVFILWPTNPTLDTSACMRCASVPVHFSATRYSILARLKKCFPNPI